MCVCVQILRVVSQYLTTHDCPLIHIITIILPPIHAFVLSVALSIRFGIHPVNIKIQIFDKFHTVCHDELLIIRKKKTVYVWEMDG